jgi:hypothetical protein
MPIEYQKTVPFTGSAKRALAVAQSTLLALNFQIAASTDYELSVTGRGISSTRENPLKAMTEGTFIIRNSAIEVKAILGGAERMVKFLRIFPLLMAVFFMVLWGILAFFIPIFRHWWIFAIPLAALSPWLVLAPLIGRSIKTRTTNAIDSLVSNMVMLGNAD